MINQIGIIGHWQDTRSKVNDFDCGKDWLNYTINRYGRRSSDRIMQEKIQHGPVPQSPCLREGLDPKDTIFLYCPCVKCSPVCNV